MSAPATELRGSDPWANLDNFPADRFKHRSVKRGNAIYQAGDAFRNFYSVRCGSFKTAHADGLGREQVIEFFIRGELFGLDGIAATHYDGKATALEDSVVVILPYALLEKMARGNQGMQRQLHAIFSMEINRHHSSLLVLGSMAAHARLASFLVDLSKRFKLRGCSPTELSLPMTRTDISSYLGMKVETVSRCFTRFQEEGLLEVHLKHVRIVDADGLRRRIVES